MAGEAETSMRLSGLFMELLELVTRIHDDDLVARFQEKLGELDRLAATIAQADQTVRPRQS